MSPRWTSPWPWLPPGSSPPPVAESGWPGAEERRAERGHVKATSKVPHITSSPRAFPDVVTPPPGGAESPSAARGPCPQRTGGCWFWNSWGESALGAERDRERDWRGRGKAGGGERGRGRREGIGSERLRSLPSAAWSHPSSCDIYCCGLYVSDAKS